MVKEGFIIKKINFLITFIALTLFISINVYASPTNIRLSGGSRYETSAKIALNGWTKSDYAVLALGENYPDALCSAPLAGKYKAPILLTEKDSLPSSTLSTIQQLQVKNIFIIGGTGVISSAVENQLTSLGIAITRLFGQDRYETAIAVAKQLGTVSQIAVVTGNDYADALSIAPIAVKLNMPIILVRPDSIPQAVKDYIASQNISQTYVIGKGTSISNEDGLTNVTEINGQDKYIRNNAIITTFKGSLDFSTFYLATGENFADALSGSVLAGINGSPLLLVGNIVEKEKDLLKTIAPNGNIKTLGGIGAVSDSAISNLTGKPQAPTALKATAVSSSGIQLQWNPVDGADYYYVYTSRDLGATYGYLINSDKTKKQYKWQPNYSVNVVNVTSFSTIFYKVTSVKDGIESYYSEIVSATTFGS